MYDICGLIRGEKANKSVVAKEAKVSVVSHDMDWKPQVGWFDEACPAGISLTVEMWPPFK